MTKRFFSFLLVCAAACTNTDRQPAKPPVVIADYKIWGEEGNPFVTTLIQFYEDEDKRNSLLLREPASVYLDGQLLRPDSARLSGAFYEAQHPLEGFPGRHSITFTNNEGKKFREEFSFVAFRLRSELPEELPRRNLELELEGLPAEQDVLRVVLTDTSFYGSDINRLDTVRNGRLVLEKADLDRLKSGPVVLQLIREEDRPLQSGLRGQLSVSYGLTRSFFLTD